MLFPIRFAFALWCVAEVLAFVLVARLIGLGGAVLATFGTSAIGFVLLRRTGAAALIKLRAVFRGRITGTGGGVVAEALAVLAALALLLPGFLSDLLGLALSIPPLRARVAARITGGGLKTGRRWMHGTAAVEPNAGVLDLEPAEWQRTDVRRPADDAGRGSARVL